MRHALPLAIACPFFLTGCSNPAEQALEKAERSKNPHDCVQALLSILEEANQSREEKIATQRLIRLKTVIANFNSSDSIIFLTTLKEVKNLERLQSLDRELTDKRLDLPSIFIHPN